MKKNKPNILFILTDQQRRDSMKAYGNNWINTPNLDSLSEKSELILGRGESAFVERNCHHRIENISSVEPLEIIEVQTGDYLGEDDIVRVEDDYGR